MGEWHLIQTSREPNISYVSKTTLTAIAELLGGEVKYASDWGFTEITGLRSAISDLTKLPIWKPSDSSLYGFCFFDGQSYGSSDSTAYALKLDEPVTSPFTAFSSSFYIGSSPYNTLRVFVGDGFGAIANLDNQSQYYRGYFILDTFHDVKNDRDFLGFGTGGNILDLENAPDANYYGVRFEKVSEGNIIAQTDGSLYLEIIPNWLKIYETGTNLIANFIQGENFMRRYYDYSSAEKNVLINGIKYSQLYYSSLYFPTE